MSLRGHILANFFVSFKVQWNIWECFCSMKLCLPLLNFLFSSLLELLLSSSLSVTVSLQRSVSQPALQFMLHYHNLLIMHAHGCVCIDTSTHTHTLWINVGLSVFHEQRLCHSHQICTSVNPLLLQRTRYESNLFFMTLCVGLFGWSLAVCSQGVSTWLLYKNIRLLITVLESELKMWCDTQINHCRHLLTLIPGNAALCNCSLLKKQWFFDLNELNA